MKKDVIAVIYVKLYHQEDIDVISELKKKYKANASEVIRKVLRKEYSNMKRRK